LRALPAVAYWQQFGRNLAADLHDSIERNLLKFGESRDPNAPAPTPPGEDF